MITYDEWKSDLASIPKPEQKNWIKRTLRSKEQLHIFGRFFFPNIIKGTDDVPECHLELIMELSDPDDSGIIFPRGFAKSTWEKIDTIHDVIYKLEPVILYISNVLRDAQFHFESIKGELENNDLLVSVYGNVVPDGKREGTKWTNTHFETTTGINVVARGAGKGRGVNIRNQRPTKIVIDDFEDDEKVRSAEQRQKLHEWITRVIFPSKDPKRGKIKMIGTVLHEQCELLHFYNKHGGLFKKAVENGKSIWPAMWSLEDLAKMKEKIGSRAYMQEYMNEPTNDELANFSAIWIDDNIYTTLPKSKRKFNKVITLDPQSGESAMADEYAITVLGWYENDQHRYVLEQKAGRISQLEQAKQFVLMWLKHSDVRSAGIEKVLAQVAVYQFVANWRSGKLDFEGIDTTSDDPKKRVNRNIPLRAITPEGKDKVARLQMFEAAFERGEIHLLPHMKTCRDQILFLGTKAIEHDDRADSLVMALELSFRGTSLRDKGDSGYNDKQTVAGNLYIAKF